MNLYCHLCVIMIHELSISIEFMLLTFEFYHCELRTTHSIYMWTIFCFIWFLFANFQSTFQLFPTYSFSLIGINPNDKTRLFERISNQISLRLINLFVLFQSIFSYFYLVPFKILLASAETLSQLYFLLFGNSSVLIFFVFEVSL